MSLQVDEVYTQQQRIKFYQSLSSGQQPISTAPCLTANVAPLTHTDLCCSLLLPPADSVGWRAASSLAHRAAADKKTAALSAPVPPARLPHSESADSQSGAPLCATQGSLPQAG